MGWQRGARWGNGNGQWLRDDGTKGPTWDSTPRYSTDIDAAFLVVEKMRTAGWGIGLRYEGGKSNQWVADFVRLDDDLEYSGEELAPTAPLAICRAALLTVEHPAHV